MSYTASATIARLKLKGFVSTSTGITDPELVGWLNDVMRSGIVPFLKEVRDEWFVDGTESVVPDSNGLITMPNSVASTVRGVFWLNNGQPTPLARIEPELAYAYEGNNGGGVPFGFVLKGYGLKILPTNVGSVTIRLDFMERPTEMVLEEAAAEVVSVAGAFVTVSSVPIAWQTTQPTSVAAISGDSPFSAISEDTALPSSAIVGNVIELDDATVAAELSAGDWLSDVGTSPFPNIPIEFHPLLQRMLMTEVYAGTGDKRLDGSMKLQETLANNLRRTMAPRTQGNARPLINTSAPGMRRWGGGWNGT